VNRELVLASLAVLVSMLCGPASAGDYCFALTTGVMSVDALVAWYNEDGYGPGDAEAYPTGTDWILWAKTNGVDGWDAEDMWLRQDCRSNRSATCHWRAILHGSHDTLLTVVGAEVWDISVDVWADGYLLPQRSIWLAPGQHTIDVITSVSEPSGMWCLGLGLPSVLSHILRRRTRWSLPSRSIPTGNRLSQEPPPDRPW
jgi:hypothetical protein